MSSDSQLEIVPGYVDAAVGSEFPELRLRTSTVPGGSGRSSRAIKRRLATLSDRFGGRQALVFRNRPLPFAYRVFFRHIGIDPDERPTPLEEIVRGRLFHGGFVSRGMPDDALTIAMLETSVVLTAFDASEISGRLGVRQSNAGETIGEGGHGLEEGTLVLADELRPIAELFGARDERCEADRRTKMTTLVAIAVAGVSEPAVEEALWIASDCLADR